MFAASPALTPWLADRWCSGGVIPASSWGNFSLPGRGLSADSPDSDSGGGQSAVAPTLQMFTSTTPHMRVGLLPSSPDPSRDPSAQCAGRGIAFGFRRPRGIRPGLVIITQLCLIARPSTSDLSIGPLGIPHDAAAPDDVVRLARLLPVPHGRPEGDGLTVVGQGVLRRLDRCDDQRAATTSAQMLGCAKADRHIQKPRFEFLRDGLYKPRLEVFTPHSGPRSRAARWRRRRTSCAARRLSRCNSRRTSST